MTDTDTDTEYDTETEAEFDARMREHLGMDAPSATAGAPNVGGERWTSPTSLTVPGLPELPKFYGEDMPAEVREARAECKRVQQSVAEIVEAIEALDGAEKADLDGYRLAVARAEAAGDEIPKPPKPRNVAVDRARLEGQYKARREMLREAVTKFDAALERAVAEGLWERIAEKIQPAHEDAVQKLALAQQAATAIDHWRGLISRAEAAKYAAGQPVASVRPRRGSASLSVLAQALREVTERVLDTEDPYITAEYLHDEGEFTPSKYERRQWLESGGGAYMQLKALEESEDYRFTDFTRTDTPARQGINVQDYMKLLEAARSARRS